MGSDELTRAQRRFRYPALTGVGLVILGFAAIYFDEWRWACALFWFGGIFMGKAEEQINRALAAENPNAE